MFKRSAPRSGRGSWPYGIVLTLAVFIGFLLSAPVVSAATEAKPLGITKFTLQTTGATKIVALGEGLAGRRERGNHR
jgi:hypothetical protein